MTTRLPWLFASTLLIAGCSKSKPATTISSRAPVATAPAPPRPSAPRSTPEVARDDMEKILLALQRVHFAFDSTTLLPDARAALQRAGELLVKHPDVALYIDGHADQRGTTEYNLALGDRRARAVIDYLVRLGVRGDRLSAMTFGSERPLRDGNDELSHARNRRVEFRLMRGDVQLVLQDGVPFNDNGRPLGTPVAARVP